MTYCNDYRAVGPSRSERQLSFAHGRHHRSDRARIRDLLFFSAFLGRVLILASIIVLAGIYGFAVYGMAFLRDVVAGLRKMRATGRRGE